MKKMFVLIIIIFITGCGINLESEKINDKESCLKTMCDKEYGVEYIKDRCTYHGGISVRLDENGNVIHCNKND